MYNMVKRDKKFVQLVGAIVAKARIKNGLVQEHVAAMLGITRSQIAHIEKGSNGPTPETMLKLAIIFNCPIADLFPSAQQYKPVIKIPPPIKQSGRGRPVKNPLFCRPKLTTTP